MLKLKTLLTEILEENTSDIITDYRVEKQTEKAVYVIIPYYDKVNKKDKELKTWIPKSVIQKNNGIPKSFVRRNLEDYNSKAKYGGYNIDSIMSTLGSKKPEEKIIYQYTYDTDRTNAIQSNFRKKYNLSIPDFGASAEEREEYRKKLKNLEDSLTGNEKEEFKRAFNQYSYLKTISTMDMSRKRFSTLQKKFDDYKKLTGEDFPLKIMRTPVEKSYDDGIPDTFSDFENVDIRYV